jgi:hypothetical protein
MQEKDHIRNLRKIARQASRKGISRIEMVRQMTDSIDALTRMGYDRLSVFWTFDSVLEKNFYFFSPITFLGYWSRAKRERRLKKNEVQRVQQTPLRTNRKTKIKVAARAKIYLLGIQI